MSAPVETGFDSIGSNAKARASAGIRLDRKTQLNCRLSQDESAGDMSSQANEHERIRIRVEGDGLAVWATVTAGPALGLEALSEVLAGAEIVAGIDEAAVALVACALAIEAAAPLDFCVARGRAARDATPDVLELREPVGPIAGRLRDDDSFDYRERRLIVPVTVGDELGRIVPGIPGEPGTDVFGHELAAKPAAALAVVLGKGVVREESGLLRAARTGARAVDKRGAIDVVALFVHAAAVDLDSGNLETEGSLAVSGDVTTAMSVRAGADLAIKGTVDAARLEAGGSIDIRGGVLGNESALVRARGHLKLRHALSARLVAGGTLEVKRSVSNSELHAREIRVGETFLGNHAYAESRITVRDAGSPAGGSCLLRAAHPLETSNDDTDAEKTDENGARERARALLRGGPERLSARKSRDTRKGRGERPLAVNTPELGPQRLFRKRERELQPSARIEIQGTAHAGCRIDFGGRPLVLDESVRAKVFRFDVERNEVVVEEK